MEWIDAPKVQVRSAGPFRTDGARGSRGAVPPVGTIGNRVADNFEPIHGHKKSPRLFLARGSKVAATYSPTWCSSTIGAGELNFSVRNGKRWILTAITAFHYISRREIRLIFTPVSTILLVSSEVFGILVPLGFDIAAFRPAAYQRGSLPRPSMENSSWRRLRA